MNPICNFCNNTDDTCCHEADKNQAVEQEKHIEDELFNRELVRLGYGALVWGDKQ